MDKQQNIKVIDRDGIGGVISDADFLKAERALVTLDNGQSVYIQPAVLQQKSDGTYLLPVSFKSITELDGKESRVIPLVEEEIEVHKEEIDLARVVVNKIVHERQETIDQPLLEERVRVERIPKNVIVEAPIPIRHEGDEIIVSLVEEVLVVEKRLMLKEEVRITKEKTEVHKPQTVTLHREEVKIERIPFQNDGEDIQSL